MKCKFEHDGDCCNSGATQYMCKCKQPCDTIMPVSNADRIRAMSDEELARFAADRQANETYVRLTAARYKPSAGLFNATREILYAKYLYWLRQPVKDGEGDGNL